MWFVVSTDVNIFWHRRDLRIEDNAGLYHALKSSAKVQPIFIFDKSILDKLEDDTDARVSFIHDSISALKAAYEAYGGDLWVYHGTAKEVFEKLLSQHTVKAVFTNRDYEPYARKRDQAISSMLSKAGLSFHSYKDHVIFEGNEVLKKDGTPYIVFTPYKRRWLEKLTSRKVAARSFYLTAYPTHKYLSSLKKSKTSTKLITLKKMGFKPTEIPIPSKEVKQSIIKKYAEQRDYPAIQGTSRLGLHFRFGTISIREKALKAQKLNDTFLSELIWRDFYSQILYHFPHVEQGAFRPKYDKIRWENNESHYERWTQGMTGYPLVDAGMRELNNTGHMHNRVRMVVASFLTKHLLIGWRWGEAYFALKLLDFDLASNNGGWQWAAGCGTDAAPYFRIFNPTSQQKKFDKELKYIKKWVPEWGTEAYPDPVVDHREARERCLARYKEALQ